MEIEENLLETQKRMLREIVKETETEIEKLKDCCKRSFLLFWEPQGVLIMREDMARLLESLGPVATTIFQKHASIQTFIRSVDPTWVWLTPPYDVDFNEDGCVRLKEVECRNGED
jgi:hypothetical protein